MAIRIQITNENTGVAANHLQLIGISRNSDGTRTLNYGLFSNETIPGKPGGEPVELISHVVNPEALPGLDSVMQLIDQAMIDSVYQDGILVNDG
jgi:hypothetical protein